MFTLYWCVDVDRCVRRLSLKCSVYLNINSLALYFSVKNYNSSLSFSHLLCLSLLPLLGALFCLFLTARARVCTCACECGDFLV